MSRQRLIAAVWNPQTGKPTQDSGPAILDALEEGWTGPLTDEKYTEIVVFCAIQTPRKVNQLKVLTMLGANVSPRTISMSMPSRREQGLEEFQTPFPRDFKSRDRGLDFWGARKDVLTKFTLQIDNDKEADGWNNYGRVSAKGILIAHLEKEGVCPSLLPSMKKSLVLDARGAHQEMKQSDLVKALGRLAVDDPESFVWSSLGGTPKHAVDVVIRRVLHEGQTVFELTSCNRGEGALKRNERVGAYRSFWSSADLLASSFVPFTGRKADKTMLEYNITLHRKAVGGEDHPRYRAQKPQKEGNCCSKSMFAALNFLVAKDEGSTETYKSVKRSLSAAMTLQIQSGPVPRTAAN